MIDAVFFDLYETLINEVCASRPPEPSPADLLGIDPSIFGAEWKKRQEGRLSGGYPDDAAALAEICTALGQAVDEELIQRIRAQRIAFRRELFADVEDDLVAVIGRIRQMGIKTGLISNASHDETAGFSESRLIGILDCVVFSCDADCTKPNPGIYLIACDKLEVAPARCLFVGDGSLNELPGAANVGMKPYHATWFMNRWPEDWRQQHSEAWDTDYPKLHSPESLLKTVSSLIERNI